MCDIVSAHMFRIIRDTEILVREEETDDLLESVGRGLREVRRRPLVLLEIEQGMPQRVADILAENFQAEPDVTVRSKFRLGFADWIRVARLHRAPLRDPPLRQRVFWDASTPDEVFDRLKYQDILVHHPFDSFSTFEHFLRSAVHDSKVLAIKMTLYRVGTGPQWSIFFSKQRTAESRSPFSSNSRRDLRRGKTLSGPRGWRRRASTSCTACFNLKTHCKLCLVVRKGSGDAIERYAHLGTGNYNPATASVYTDFGLFTSHPRIMADLSELFNVLTGYSKQINYRELAVAPVTFRRRLQ